MRWYMVYLSWQQCSWSRFSTIFFCFVASFFWWPLLYFIWNSVWFSIRIKKFDNVTYHLWWIRRPPLKTAIGIRLIKSKVWTWRFCMSWWNKKQQQPPPECDRLQEYRTKKTFKTFTKRPTFVLFATSHSVLLICQTSFNY